MATTKKSAAVKESPASNNAEATANKKSVKPGDSNTQVNTMISEKEVDKTSTASKPVEKYKKNKVEEPKIVIGAAPIKKVAEKKEPSKPIKMPKITAQGKVPYEPDFTHSVLDGPKENAPVTTPSQRYSDSDLAEFRELISRKLETARKELSYLQGLITRKDDSGADGEDGRYMTMEDGTLSMEREQLSQMASRQIQFIDHLEKATIRIENKTYGICRETGKLIDKARLRAVPHATLSVEAKMRKGR